MMYRIKFTKEALNKCVNGKINLSDAVDLMTNAYNKALDDVIDKREWGSTRQDEVEKLRLK